MPELDDAALERRLRGVLKEHLETLPLDLTVETLDRRREAMGAARRSSRGRGITLLAAAALLIVGGALAAGSGLLRLPTIVPPVPEPSVIAVATGSPDSTSPSPSLLASPTPVPSPTPEPILWTEASLNEDWPAPVRSEPAGGSTVLPMPLTYMDPTGDTGSDIDPWVDIRVVEADTGTVRLKLVSNEPPEVDPAEQWIAYGVVTDEDRDGVPDWRYGVFNGAKGDQHVWRTNLHTGRTDDKGFLAGYGSAWPEGTGPIFKFRASGDVTGGGTSTRGIALDMPFYTWASVIVNGRVVATDYAPDVGWLKATRGAKPGGTFLIEDLFSLDLSMSVPDGWTADYGFLSYDGAGNEEISLDFMFDFTSDPPTWSCDASGDGVEAQFGPEVDDLVTFLAGLQTIRISENTDVTLDGYRGKYLEVTAVTVDNCFRRPEFDRAWIIDVDGVRLVIGASVTSASETALAELTQIVESIHFER